MTDELKYYDLVISKISYHTIRELFYLEDEKLTDFFINAIVYILEKKSGVRPLDSTGRNFHNKFYSEYESVIKIRTEFEFTKDEDVKKSVIDDGWIVIALFQQQINVSSTKVLYLSMKIDYLLSNFS